MRYLLDTNIFLFVTREGDELDSNVKTILEDYENSFVISSESIREIAALVANGKIRVKGWDTFAGIKASLDEHGIEIRYVAEAHLKTLFKIIPVRGHSDPSDLMIIAQAMTENITLISSDTKFPLYIPQGLKFVQNYRRFTSKDKQLFYIV